MSVTADGNAAAVLTLEGRVIVYDLVQGAEIASLEDEARHVTSVALVGAGARQLVTGAASGAITFWTLPKAAAPARGPSVPLHNHGHKPLDAHGGSGAVLKAGTGAGAGAEEAVPRSQVHRIAVSPDCRWLLTAGEDGTVKVVSVAHKAQKFSLVGHRAAVLDVSVSHDNLYAVSASRDRTLRVWDLASGRSVQQLQGHHAAVTGCSFGGKDHAVVASSSLDGTVRLWQALPGVVIQAFRGHDGAVNAAACGVDGPQVLSAGHDGTLRVFFADRVPFQVEQFGRDARVDAEQYDQGEPGHLGPARRCNLTSDCLRAISVGSDGQLMVWRMVSGHEERITAAAVSHCGLKVVTCSADKVFSSPPSFVSARLFLVYASMMC